MSQAQIEPMIALKSHSVGGSGTLTRASAGDLVLKSLRDRRKNVLANVLHGPSHSFALPTASSEHEAQFARRPVRARVVDADTRRH
jgi:hypothetical protein